jgi:hypothetical protein
MPMYNLPDVYSTTSTVPSTANLQVVAACSVWLSVNTGSQSGHPNVSRDFNQHAKSRSMCRLYHSTRGGHTQQPTRIHNGSSLRVEDNRMISRFWTWHQMHANVLHINH